MSSADHNTHDMIPLDSGAPAGEPQPGEGTHAVMQGLDLSAPSKRGINSGIILLAGAIAISSGIVVTMRKIGLAPTQGLLATMQLSAELPETPASAKGDHKKIIADLNASRVEQQVPPSLVKKNPFRLTGAVLMGDPVAEATPIDPVEAAARAAADKLAREQAAKNKSVDDAYAKLFLNGVMDGATPVARINGRAYRVGQVVDKTFTIEGIEGRSVQLRAGDRVLILTMPERKYAND